MHKGFKCLEPSTGRVYISRYVAFDETVYPFAQLHPNAGARLRAEILHLPEKLQNPSSFGANNDYAPSVVSPNTVTEPLDAGADHVVINSSEESAATSGDFVIPGIALGVPSNDISSQGVFPAPAPATNSISSSDQPPIGPTGAASAPTHLPAAPDVSASPRLPSGGGCPRPTTPVATPLCGIGSPVRMDAPPAVPTQGGMGAASSSMPVLPLDGSSTPAAPEAPNASSLEGSAVQHQRPVTRLQHGIRKPKVFTDGRIHWCNLAVTTEPSTLQEALNNADWKLAMDKEYDALIRNQTWHLVPP